MIIQDLVSFEKNESDKKNYIFFFNQNLEVCGWQQATSKWN